MSHSYKGWTFTKSGFLTCYPCFHKVGTITPYVDYPKAYTCARCKKTLEYEDLENMIKLFMIIIPKEAAAADIQRYLRPKARKVKF